MPVRQRMNKRTFQMNRTIYLAAFALATTVSSTATAQVVAYHHRSTVAGDAYAGAAELVRANGAFLRDEADAAETWVRVDAARDDLHYRRAEYRYQSRQMELDYRQQRFDHKQQQHESESAAQQLAAVRLLESARRGVPIWPAALRRPEYAGSTSMVESVLRNWNPQIAGDDVYRRALATEAAVLRNRVASNESIKFSQRVEAVETIKQLQLLVEMTPAPATPADQGVADARLAMK